MGWRGTNEFETALLEDTEARWPEVLPLACCLTLAPRIEPLMLRNARRQFAPKAQAEVESLLWFSPLVAARSTREIVLHLGVARALALADDYEAYRQQDLGTLWEFTRFHTRHWSTEDRLERDLRYYALRDEKDKLVRGLREMLRRVNAAQEEKQRVDLSRLAKRTLPVVAATAPASGEVGLLAQYAALALGDAGSWTRLGARPGSPRTLPAWLSDKLPSPVDSAELGVEVRRDPELGQVLHLIDARDTKLRITFPSPLPARLHVAGDGDSGGWHTVTIDSRIRISPSISLLRLTTLDGRQWKLDTEMLEGGEHDEREQPSPPLLLVYVEADREQAQTIAGWLQDEGMTVEMVEDTGAGSGAAMTTDARVVRLWTRAAQAFWADRITDQDEAMAGGVLLRTEDVNLPAAGAAAGAVLDWRDWSRLSESDRAERIIENLQRWRESGEIESEPDAGVAQEDRAAAYGEEIAALLDEIDDPATEPPRRLEIGDLLAELGDPRPGVGVVEIEESDRSDQPGDTIEGHSPDVQQLLDEIDDPATEPPRRLAIGNELERLGDPRRGVGLDEHGLPDIDWVEIPSGLFTYQDGETRELPTFWIARYPITNQQFQAFVDAGGYKKARGLLKQASTALGATQDGADWWQNLKKPDPTTSHWPEGNRPRTDVNWYEAVAFTRWLTARLGLEEEAIRLPTEVEWEKAARGTEGLTYPWGNDYRSGFANINETLGGAGSWHLEQTTAVGMYPHGRSPFDVEDMAGTVWEWCLNKHKQPEDTTADFSNDRRVLRGGSWLNSSDIARADSRLWYHPVLRLNLAGLRVLSSVPIAVS